jgi:signal transduction histidine kinase
MLNHLLKYFAQSEPREMVSHALAMQRMQAHIDALEEERRCLFSLSESPFSLITLKFSCRLESPAQLDLVHASSNVSNIISATPSALSQNPLLILEQLTPASARRIKRKWQVSVKRMQPFKELICLNLHGDAHWLNVQVTPERRGNLLLWQCLALDVTALHKDHEAQKKSLQDQLSSLTRLSVHTRMQLQTITDSIQQMQKNESESGVVSLEKINYDCVQLTEVLDEVMDTAASVLDKVQLADDAFLLTPWLESLASTWQHYAKNRALSFSLSLENCEHVVQTDRNRLALVLRRLFFSTIATALPGEVRVHVACQTKAQQLHITVAISSLRAKDGVGVSHSSFLDFYDAEVETPSTLTWTQQMARRLGGSVGSSSVENGRFTFQLRISLPLAKAPVEIDQRLRNAIRVY